MTAARAPWYGAPVLWLGATILLVVIAGCISLIVSATRFPDQTVAQTRETILKVPASRATEPAGDEH